jgi:hypothetical protein
MDAFRACLLLVGTTAFLHLGRETFAAEPPSPSEPAFEKASNKELLDPEFVGCVRRVIAAVVAAAKECDLDGDERTEALVRAAAGVEGLPPERQARAVLLGLAVAMDRGAEMRASVMTKRFWTAYESDAERSKRLRVLGRPTILGREDLAKHFFISTGLTAVMTPAAAEAAGILKEVSDANGGTGFSWIDMGANLAGIEFARHLIVHRPTPIELAREFRVETFVPRCILDLQEGIMLEELRNEFSLDSRIRFQAEVDRIRKHVSELPIYTGESRSEPQAASR